MAGKAIAIFAGLTMFGCHTHAAEFYQNREYGFSVGTNFGAGNCMAPAPSPNHGIGFPLDDSVSCDDFLRASHRVAVFANYNALETPSLTKLRDETCKLDGRWHDMPMRLHISGKRIIACRVDSADGKIAVLAFALTKPRAEPISWINYEIGLWTTADRYDRDLPVFEAILKDVRFSKPQ